jgi:diaminohydroxyphosphoribosylaminopyrimidine deaminase/5-amino-6-(5-phosphoribosylamino)uracil reductase
MTKNHNLFLNLAFHLAEKNLGQTKLNPSVGTVIVKNESVISSGVTSLQGRPHSEFNALKNLKNCSGASLYTTLEPCTHYAKTPPCTNIIIKKKIKNVFYAFEDPDIRTFKKAKKVLSEKGIKTKLVRTKNYINFYRSYFINKRLSIPFITAKIAISKDFFTINKKEKWITNERSRNKVHLLRSRHDCILSTSKSINQDDSLLNCRLNGLNNKKPDLFIIDLKLKLKKNLSLNKYLKVRKTFLITSKNNSNKTLAYKKLGYKILFINKLENKQDLYLLYKKIYKIGYSRMLVEVGLTFLNNLIKNKMIHDLFVFKSNKRLGKNGKNNNSTKYLKKIHPKILTINLNGDNLLKKEF